MAGDAGSVWIVHRPGGARRAVHRRTEPRASTVSRRRRAVAGRACAGWRAGERSGSDERAWAAGGRALAADIHRIVERRAIASIVLTADQSFARAVAKEVLVLEPATGMLKPISAW